MKFRHILITLTVIFTLIGLFIYIEPSITGFAIQERFLISDIKVNADGFNQELRVEQLEVHEIKFENALYYFTIKPEYEQEINYMLIEFIVDSSQIRDYDKQDIGLYLYEDGWLALDTEFIKQDGRFYYHNAKAENFGLFVVAPREEKIFLSGVNKNDLLLFGLLPLFIFALLFSILIYSGVRLVQRINYRVFLLFKKSFIGLTKFGLSLGVVILILGILSPKYGDIGEVNLVYYAIIPLLILSLLSTLILNFVLKIYRFVSCAKWYGLFKKLSFLFSFILILVLAKFVPQISGYLTNIELVVFGLLPVVFGFYLFYVLVKKLVYFRI